MNTIQFQKMVGTVPDGDFGPKSLAATLHWADHLVSAVSKVAAKYPDAMRMFADEMESKTSPVVISPPAVTEPLHERTERNILTLSPKTQALARQFIKKVNASLEGSSAEVRIISGNRTYEEQDAIYLQGRTSLAAVNNARKAAGLGPIPASENVERTKARAGYSNHNFGVAWDVGVFVDGIYKPEHSLYKTIGPVGESLGLEWGGRWDKPDYPHYSFKTGLTLAQMRKLKSQGMPIG